jgi:hypothetical protein
VLVKRQHTVERALPMSPIVGPEAAGLIPFAHGVAAGDNDSLRVAAADGASKRGALASHHLVERPVIHGRCGCLPALGSAVRPGENFLRFGGQQFELPRVAGIQCLHPLRGERAVEQFRLDAGREAVAGEAYTVAFCAAEFVGDYLVAPTRKWH